MRRAASRFSLLLTALLWPAMASAQHASHQAIPDIQSNLGLNATEIATGLAAAIVAFQAALAYREGKLGKGMSWVAVGMVIMSVGHFILVTKRFLNIDPLGFLGQIGSFVAFSFAVFASFTASAFGFWLMRRAAKVQS